MFKKHDIEFLYLQSAPRLQNIQKYTKKKYNYGNDNQLVPFYCRCKKLT